MSKSMKKACILLLALFLCSIARAQTTQNPLAVNLTAQSADCSVANSCAWQLITFTAGQTVVTLAGTFSGTFIVEQTNNGTSWTSAGTLSSSGTTTYNSNGYTAIRVRCSAYTSGAAAVTVSTGTGGSSSGGVTTITPSNTVPPVDAYYASPNCPLAGTKTCTFVYADGYLVASDVTTASNGVITCPNNDCNFLTINQPQYGSTVVGMSAWVVTTPASASLGPSGVPACAISTIASATAQSITLASGSCATVLTANGSLIIGHKDSTNLTTAWNNTGCSELVLPSLSGNPIAPAGTQAILLDDVGQFNTTPTNAHGCNGTGYGNWVYYQPSIRTSVVSTGITLTPDFAWTAGNCPGVGSGVNSCFGDKAVSVRGVVWNAFGMASCGTNRLAVLSAGGNRLESVQVSNICPTNANLTGILLWGQTFHFSQGGAQNVGGVSCEVLASGKPGFMYTSYCGGETNASGVGLQVDTGASVEDVSGVQYGTLIHGGTLISHGSTAFSTTGIGAAVKVDTSGGIFVGYNSYVDGSNLSSGTGLWLSASGAKAQLHNMQLIKGNAAAGGFGISEAAGATIVDECGNAAPIAGGSGNSYSGIVSGSCSITGTALVTGNVGLTSGWGSSTVTSASGDSHRMKFAISVTGVPGASPVITVTFPTPFWVAPASCSIQEVSGTFGIITNPSIGAPGTTSVAITFSGTPVATNTYTFDLSCGP